MKLKTVPNVNATANDPGVPSILRKLFISAVMRARKLAYPL
jgi:hypothetical protein